MCSSCLREYEATTAMPATPEMHVASILIRAHYVEHPVGGNLHIVLDDYNIEDSAIDWCEANTELTEQEQAIVAQLRPMTLAQRAASIGLAHGDFD